MKDKEKPKPTTAKVVTIKKGSTTSAAVDQTEVRPTARERVEAMLEAERFRLSSLAVSLALVIVFSAVILVICSILISSFKLTLLTMASENFRAAPVIMVIASCLSIGRQNIQSIRIVLGGGGHFRRPPPKYITEALHMPQMFCFAKMLFVKRPANLSHLLLDEL
jgi:hypothetical protein